MPNNKIQFKRFCGTNTSWESRVSSSKWNDSVVFGRIWNTQNKKWECKIYAGHVEDSSANITFLYDIPSVQELKEIENLIHINTDTSSFDNQTFIEAIQRVIDNYVNLDEINNRLVLHDTSINIINDSISWQTEN